MRWLGRKQYLTDADQEWHRWFAWHPVVLQFLDTDTYRTRWVWLEFVERRFVEDEDNPEIEFATVEYKEVCNGQVGG